MFAQIVTTGLMMAYAIIGFAVLHTLTLAVKSRAIWLTCTYVVVAISLAGSGDDGARPRRRRLRTSQTLFAEDRPPPLPAS